MRSIISTMLSVVLLIAGMNVFAQNPTTPDETTTLTTQVDKLKQEARQKKGKKLTRYEETDLEKQVEFMAAVKAGDLPKAKETIKSQYFYAFDEDGETALTRSIKNNDVDMVQFLEKNAVINLENKQGETPLILAIEGGDEAIIEIIMERANPSLQDAQGMSPMMMALKNGDLELAQGLIRKGADLNKKSNGISPLFYAVKQNNMKAVALLAHHGADPSLANEDGDIPLYHAIRNGDNIMTGILLHKSSNAVADANWKTRDGEPLLNLAIQEDKDQISRMLLDFGASIYQTDYLENTPLNLAARQGDAALVKILLERGADPNHRNITGETPLLTAARKGHGQVADLLAEAGADTQLKDFDGFAAADRRNFNGLTDPEIIDAVMQVTDDYE